MSTYRLKLEQSRHLYSILEIPDFSSIDEVRVAYKALALRYHPDKNLDDPHASDRFKEVCAVYELLADEVSKKRYDTALRVFHICTGVPASSAGSSAAWSRCSKDEGKEDGTRRKRTSSYMGSEATSSAAIYRHCGGAGASYPSTPMASSFAASATTGARSSSAAHASSSARSASDRATNSATNTSTTTSSQYTEEQKLDFRRRENERIARLCKQMQEMKAAKREHERAAQQRALDRRAHWDEQRRAVHQRAFSASQPSQRTSSTRSNGRGAHGMGVSAAAADDTGHGVTSYTSLRNSYATGGGNASPIRADASHRSGSRRPSYRHASRPHVVASRYGDEEAAASYGAAGSDEAAASSRESCFVHSAVPPMMNVSHLQSVQSAVTTDGSTVSSAATPRYPPPLSTRTRSRVSSSRSSSAFCCPAGAKDGSARPADVPVGLTPRVPTRGCDETSHSVDVDKLVAGTGPAARVSVTGSGQSRTPRWCEQDTPKRPLRPRGRDVGSRSGSALPAAHVDRTSEHETDGKNNRENNNSNHHHNHRRSSSSYAKDDNMHSVTRHDATDREGDRNVCAIDKDTIRSSSSSSSSRRLQRHGEGVDDNGTMDTTAAATTHTPCRGRGSLSIMRGRDVHRTAAAREEMDSAPPLPPQRVTRTASLRRVPCAASTATDVDSAPINGGMASHAKPPTGVEEGAPQQQQQQQQHEEARYHDADVRRVVHAETTARVRLAQLQQREWAAWTMTCVQTGALVMKKRGSVKHNDTVSEKENASKDVHEKNASLSTEEAIHATAVSSVSLTRKMSSPGCDSVLVEASAASATAVSCATERCDETRGGVNDDEQDGGGDDHLQHADGGVVAQPTRAVSSLMQQLMHNERTGRAALAQCQEDEVTDLIRWHARARHHRYAVEKATALRLAQSRYQHEMAAMRAQIVQLKEMVQRMSESTMSHAFKETAFDKSVPLN